MFITTFNREVAGSSPAAITKERMRMIITIGSKTSFSNTFPLRSIVYG